VYSNGINSEPTGCHLNGGLLGCVLTGSGAHLVSSPKGTGGKAAEV